MKLDRRQFLEVAALAGGGFAVGFAWPTAEAATEAGADPFAPNPWIRITPDNGITVVVDKAEMGQGVCTGLPMIVAEELDADWARIRIEAAPAAKAYAHPWFGVQGTGGSSSVRAMWLPLRQAGATARAMLVAAAAQAWEVDAATLRTDRGSVIGPMGVRATYGKLCTRAAKLAPPKDVPLKDPRRFRIIGKSTPRLDTPEKVDGTATFGLDVGLPGLLTAVVARSPVAGGRVGRHETTRALAVPGVRQVVRVDGPLFEGVAVLAESYWAASAGRDALDIVWDAGANATLSSDALQARMATLAASGDGARTAHRDGDSAAAMAAAVQVIEAVYEVPYLAHAPMEPMNCTAWVRPDGVEIWAGTQAPGPNQATVARLVGCRPEQVTIHSLYLGGGFGRRFAPDALTEAVLLSRAANAPVKVVYTREDDTRGGYYRPMAVAKLRAGLDAAGHPVAFTATTVCDSIAEGSGFEAALIRDGIDATAVEGLANLPYAMGAVEVRWVPFPAGIRTWYLRSVGSTQNAFFGECFVDEMAQAAGRDPLEFRRTLLAQRPRERQVLELAAQKAGWGSTPAPGRARGIAMAASFGSYVAQVAEVSLEDGRPRVHRVVIAADVGMVVNPQQVVAQMEGAMVYGLSAALYGRITLRDGMVEQGNFHDYPVLRMAEMPEVEVHLVPSTEAPGGVGEPGTPPIAPAVANALFALTGRRHRSLPLVA
jgi:isoquinoline 1-oxidoreductase beta subunit